jgi:dihydroflavonol-4-reductase
MAPDRLGITGANGFIGAHLLRSAVARGFRPFAFLQKTTSLEPIADLEGKYEAVFGDLLDRDSVDAFAGKCDAIFHLAGLNRYWVQDRTLFHRVNVLGVQNLADACSRRGVRKLVHTSSCITLGASDGACARNEDSPYNLGCLNFLYADTKKAGEEEIKHRVRERGLQAVIVNPTSAIGERDFGPTPIGKPIADIARGMWPVYVAGGACFIDVHDVVRGLWLALERGTVGRQYLLVGENLSNQEFMTKVAGIAGVARPRLKAPKALLDVVGAVAEWTADRFTRRAPALTSAMSGLIGRYLFFDGGRAHAELGFKAGPVAPAIERCIRWFRQAR